MTRAVLWYSLYLFCLAFLEEKIQAKIQNLVPFFTRSPPLCGGGSLYPIGVVLLRMGTHKHVGR